MQKFAVLPVREKLPEQEKQVIVQDEADTGLASVLEMLAQSIRESRQPAQKEWSTLTVKIARNARGDMEKLMFVKDVK